MRFREVLLVIALLLAGVVVYEVQTGNWTTWGWTFNEDGEFFGFGKAYSFEETQTIEAPVPSNLDVTNIHGWVEVRGADQETVQLTFQKKIWRRDEADARAVADKLHDIVKKTADRLSFSTNRDDFAKRNFETGFILVVPRRMKVTVTNSYGPVKVTALEEADVRNRHGRVSASDIKGACALESSYGDIEAENLKAGCRVIDRHADVKLLSVAGDLGVDHSYGEVRFEDIGGKAVIGGSHSAVDGRRVQGPVSVESSYERISIIDAGATRVRAHHCRVEAQDIHGDLDVETTYEPVKAMNVQGSLRVNGNNVAVTASLIKGPEIAVTSSYENVDLEDFSAKVTGLPPARRPRPPPVGPEIPHGCPGRIRGHRSLLAGRRGLAARGPDQGRLRPLGALRQALPRKEQRDVPHQGVRRERGQAGGFPLDDLRRHPHPGEALTPAA